APPASPRLTLLEQIDVRTRHQSGLRNPQRRHQFARDSFPLDRGFAVCQNDLDLQESPESVDFVEVDARAADHEDLASFLYDTPNAQRSSQDRRDGLASVHAERTYEDS